MVTSFILGVAITPSLNQCSYTKTNQTLESYYTDHSFRLERVIDGDTLYVSRHKMKSSKFDYTLLTHPKKVPLFLVSRAKHSPSYAKIKIFD